MVKKNTKTIVGIIIIALIAGYFITTSLTILPTNLFAKPLWARLECAPTDSFEGIEKTLITKSSNGQSIYCGLNEFTDKCKVRISVDNVGIEDDRINYQTCNNDGTQCTATQQTKIVATGTGSGPGNVDLPELDKGKKHFVWCIEGQLFSTARKDCTATKEYKPWKIFRFVGGSKFEVKDNNCDLTDKPDLKSGIPTEDYRTSLTMTGGEGSKWINYVYDWAFGPATNIVNYNGQESYCVAPNVYSIVKLKTADNQLVKLNPEYKDDKEDTEVINGLGNIIARVECCYPIENNCGSDFKFKPVDTSVSIKCFSDVQCLNAGGPIPTTSTSYVKYQCINEVCTKSAPVTVQCTTNSACGSGQICDLSATNYGKCIQQTAVEYCGNGKCDSRTETAQSCATDCGVSDLSDCTRKGGTIATEEKCSSLACNFKLAKPTITTYCKKPTNYIPLAIIAGIVIIIIAYIFKGGRKKR